MIHSKSHYRPQPLKNMHPPFFLWLLPWQGLQPVGLPNFYLESQPDFHPDTRNHLHSGGKSAARDDYLQRLWGRKKERMRNYGATDPLAYLRKTELTSKMGYRKGAEQILPSCLFSPSPVFSLWQCRSPEWPNSRGAALKNLATR